MASFWLPLSPLVPRSETGASHRLTTSPLVPRREAAASPQLPVPETSASSSSSLAPRFRLRAAAEELMNDRQQAVGETDNSETPQQKLCLSTDWNINLTGRIKRVVVSRAFEIAAEALVQALRRADNEPDDNRSHGSSGTLEDDIPHLPAALQARRILSRARAAALQRSLDNKEWGRRKTTTTTPSSAAATATSTKKGPKETKTSSTLASQATSNKNKADKSTAAAETTTAPKFTRNTPASSAAALDHRFTNSRAVLCAAGNLTLTLSAAASGDGNTTTVDPGQVPQAGKIENLGSVIVDATVYSRRARNLAENSFRRAQWRYRFRHRQQSTSSSTSDNDDPRFSSLQIPNLFSPQLQSWNAMWEAAPPRTNALQQPNLEALTSTWQTYGRPAMRRLLQTDSDTKVARHALYYDTEWTSRHARLADALYPSSSSENVEQEDWGPHLIITTQPDVGMFAAEFNDWRTFLNPSNVANSHRQRLRASQYGGTPDERRSLRHLWSTMTMGKGGRGQTPSESPVHVFVMSYTTFLQDYLHVCQVSWGTVLLDDGASWMAAGLGDPNSALGSIWEKAVLSTKDQCSGLAGSMTTSAPWDFQMEDWREQVTASDNTAFKEACIGLTARHRILTISKTYIEQKSSVDLLPVSGLVNFLAPHFASVVREEWDRSNISKDADSMDHFRRLVAHYTIVQAPDATTPDNGLELATRALQGNIPTTHRDGDLSQELAPEEISEDSFIEDEKVLSSRRASLGWLGQGRSYLRYELGKADFAPIFEAMKVSNKFGHYCEQVSTASSMTNSGALGQVVGTMAYRSAVRCGRHFGSHMGLSQHISAQHAPPGTWLCRTCGTDCVTSQARTHHERACGQTAGGNEDAAGTTGGAPATGQGGPRSGVGKKKKTQRNGTTGQNGPKPGGEKDSDGSFRVPGYRGVWVTKSGKHFIKVDGKRFGEKENATMLFDTLDDAAKKYDEVAKDSDNDGTVELNFKPDGSRIVYEDAKSTTASGVGGSAANVVPMLSVININDLPPHIKPLLRDPRQTSRTGGNSKRHVYAYRGVCRQARKGHDRWQSQISFMGVNHYLGTFDSEWDAAAIYAWAHLILYGEEATRQAQKEGEEAAAAYEQEKKDIAAGKIPTPAPKPEKKAVRKKEPKEKAAAPKKEPKEKITPVKKKRDKAMTVDGENGETVKKTDKESGRKRKLRPSDSKPPEKKAKVSDLKTERETLMSVVSKGAAKAPILSHREAFEGLGDGDLRKMVSMRVHAVRSRPNSLSFPSNYPPPAIEALRSCVPAQNPKKKKYPKYPVGAAMLIGIPASLGWSLADFITYRVGQDFSMVQILAAEYDDEGLNEKFKSVMQGSLCIIGQASKKMIRQFQEIGGGNVEMGSGCGPLDCHIGGAPGACSPRAASIRYDGEVFRFTRLNDDDVVTLNGKLLRPGGPGYVLYNYDVCSVGPRVFAFVLPTSF